MRKFSEYYSPIEGKLPEIIESFVQVYGEENRAKITERLKDTTIIYASQDTLEFLCNKYLNKIKGIFGKFCESINSHNYEYSIDTAITFDSSNFNMLIQDLKECNIEILKNNDLFNIIFENYFDADFSKKSLNEQNEILKNNLNALIDRINEAKQIWMEKYDKNFTPLKENYHELIEYRDNAMNEDNEVAEENEYNERIVSYLSSRTSRLNIYKLMETISSFEEFLNCDLNNIPQEKEREFIELCKTLGFDCGENFYDYINNSDIKAFFNNKDLELLSNKRQQRKQRKLCKASMFECIIEQLKELDFKDGNAFMAKRIFDFISENDKSVGGECIPYLTSDGKIKSICVVPITAADSTVIHELGHAIQYEPIPISLNNNTLLFKVGLCQPCFIQNENNIDITSFSDFQVHYNFLEKETANAFSFIFDETEGSKDKAKKEFRDFIKEKELFSQFMLDLLEEDKINLSNTQFELYIMKKGYIDEIVNEYLSQQVLLSMHERGVYITNKTKKPNLYTYAFPFVADFLKKYKKELASCAISSKIESFERFIGLNNSIRMANILNKFFENEKLLYCQNAISTYSCNAGKTEMDYIRTFLIENKGKLEDTESFLEALSSYFGVEEPLKEKEFKELVLCYAEMDDLLEKIAKYIKLKENNDRTVKDLTSGYISTDNNSQLTNKLTKETDKNEQQFNIEK